MDVEPPAKKAKIVDDKYLLSLGRNDACVKENGEEQILLQFSLSDRKGALADALQAIKDADIDMRHIESRPSCSNPGKEYDFFVDCTSCHQEQIDNLTSLLKPLTTSFTLQKTKPTTDEVHWFPRKIVELDTFINRIAGYGDELDADHPGFNDPEYCKRRKMFADIAFNYKHGQPIPHVEYTPEEIKTWSIMFRELTKLHPTHACQEYNYMFPLLVENCGYREDNIPQLEVVSNYLKECTGFQLRPAAGLLTIRDFLAGLAFRVLHATQFVRHSSKPWYSPEPDVCHELMGHAPLLANPEYAKFAQEIGLASLGAPDEYVKKLSTFFWFSIEFGICMQKGERRVYGAGILSSFGELEYCLTNKPSFLPFEPEKMCVQHFPVTEMQPAYFVADNFQSAQEKLRWFAATIPKPCSLFYNPFTQSIEVLDNKESLGTLANSIEYDTGLLQEAIRKMK